MRDERPRRPVLLYDAGWRLCRFAARVVALLDRGEELAFLPLRDPEATSVLAGLAEEERFSTWRLALPDGSLVGYGAGGAYLFAAMRLTRPIGRMVAHAPQSVLDGIYGIVARSRGSLERLVPDGPGPKRFP